MISSLFKHLLNLLIFGLSVFATHFLIWRAFENLNNGHQIIDIHAFLFILTFAGTVFTIYLLKRRSAFVGYAFMGISLMKMFLSVIFLLPAIKNSEHGMSVYVIQFLLIYAIYLTYEVIYLVSLLKKSDK